MVWDGKSLGQFTESSAFMAAATFLSLFIFMWILITDQRTLDGENGTRKI